MEGIYTKPSLLFLDANGDVAGMVTPEVPDSSPLAIEDMMEDSPLPVALPASTQYSDVEIMSPTPAYDNDNRNNDKGGENYVTDDTSMEGHDSMVTDTPVRPARKPSLEGPKLSAVE